MELQQDTFIGLDFYQQRRLPGPELIYIPPRFHIGTLLMAQVRYAEAESWLARAIDGGIDKRVRFLCWRGDALMSLAETGKAKESCCLYLNVQYKIDFDVA